MCGRFTLTTPPQAVATLFDLVDVPPLLPRYNIAPSQNIPVIGARRDGTGRGLTSMTWGFVPRWSGDHPGMRPINARSETAIDKPMFRDALRKRRCLIPADGFYEWQRDSSPKQPFHFRQADQGPFAMAGFWDYHSEPDSDQRIYTCCLLTTSANDLLAPIHDRMPVILDRDSYSRWLDPALDDQEITGFFQPYPAEKMQAVKVSTTVNNARNETPDCLKEV